MRFLFALSLLLLTLTFAGLSACTQGPDRTTSVTGTGQFLFAPVLAAIVMGPHTPADVEVLSLDEDYTAIPSFL